MHAICGLSQAMYLSSEQLPCWLRALKPACSWYVPAPALHMHFGLSAPRDLILCLQFESALGVRTDGSTQLGCKERMGCY